MSWVKRTLDDEVLINLRRVNKIRLGNVRQDNARAPHTIIFSIKFLVPEADTRRMDDLPGFSTVRYPRPIRGLREKKIFAPIRTEDGIMLRVFWYKYLGTETQVEARREVARFLDRIYPLTRDLKRPVVALRAHLVDWDVGFALEKSKLKDPWYAERTFGGIKIDTFNLKSWGMAESSPILNKDRSALRGSKMDSYLERYERRNPNSKEVVDPITEKMKINPVALVRRELQDFLAEVEKQLPKMLVKAKGLRPNIADLRAKQILTLLRTSYFEQSVREKLFQIFLDGYNDLERGPNAADRRKMTDDLRAWLWASLERRFL